ncbi:MAG: hypothetical protein ACKOFA_00580 [Rhodoluna sp.]
MEKKYLDHCNVSTSVMTIENVLEDLEAQAFFANLTKDSKQSQKILSAIITFGISEKLVLQVTSPIVGKDFIAGFASRNAHPVWLIIPKRSLRSIRCSTTDYHFQESELNLKQLIDQKLHGVCLAIKFLDGSYQRATLLGASSWLIQLEVSGANEFTSLTAIDHLIVENLSDLG